MYLTGGQNKKGAEFFKRAIALDPNDSKVINSLAFCYQAMGKPEKGVDLLKEYISRVPDDSNLIDSLGVIYFLMGQIDQAINTWKEALVINPNQFGSMESLTYAYALKEQYPSGMNWLDRSITVSTRRYKAFFDYWLGNKAKAFADLDKAEKLYTENKLSSPAIVGIYYLRGWIACDSGEVEAGERYFEEMAELNKRFFGNLRLESEGLKDLGLTFAELKKGTIDSAKSRLETIRQLCTEMPDVRKRKTFLRQCDLLSAEILLREGAPQKAVQLLEQTVPFEAIWLSYPTFMIRWHTPQLQDVRARAYVQMGKIDKAIAEYERLVTFDPKSKEFSLIHPLYHYRLAKLYEQKNLKAKAAEQYQKFLSLWKDTDPGLPEVDAAKKRLAGLKGQVVES